MDKMRSLQYFIASAEHGSFSGAARSLEVTIPAVAKLVSTLEKNLGVRLFERSAQGLVLTAAGESYLESCRPAVALLDELDEQMRASGTRTRGTVVVGIQHLAAKDVLAPALPRFLARHPEIQVDLRESTQLVAPDAPGVDMYLSFSWPKSPDLVHRSLAMTRFVVCASPAYWAAHGMPSHPRELVDHNCLLIRTQTGMVMDVWNFRRGAETEQVTVKGSLVCNNAHRDVAIALAAAGQGVVRTLEWTHRAGVIPGALVPAFTDWELPDAPPMNLSYRPSARRTARVRLFIDFVLEVFRELESPAARVGRVATAPHWANRRVARASSLPRARR
jgi:LysR family transcriptional regulator for bpeEF and oprC